MLGRCTNMVRMKKDRNRVQHDTARNQSKDRDLEVYLKL